MPTFLKKFYVIFVRNNFDPDSHLAFTPAS